MNGLILNLKTPNAEQVPLAYIGTNSDLDGAKYEPVKDKNKCA